jgi:hypothetical protein
LDSVLERLESFRRAALVVHQRTLQAAVHLRAENVLGLQRVQ